MTERRSTWRSRACGTSQGFTGFEIIDQVTSPDERIFLGDCWVVLMPLGGRVLSRPPPMPGPITNFREVVVEALGRRVSILCNEVHPWAGFREPLGPGSILSRFLDPPALMSAFEALGRYRILKAE